mmetsp:Transcript_132069/g.229621  ORF Transcript_132069/g.229621 Transcript_132069/m.229621 type:complete len:307 (-) Transcript_132069:127-1047(-)
MNSIVLLLLMLVSSSSALKISAKSKDPLLVQLLADAGHGSTALEMLLMSSSNVATLCKGGTWQCEPCPIDRELCAGTDHDVNVLRNATGTWADYWDLSRPLLMKKAMFETMGHKVMESHQTYIKMVTEGLPQRMKDASIHGLRFAYIAMWRPLCLASLSSATPGVIKEVEQLEYLDNLVARLRQETDAQVLVINYGSLLWDLEKTKKRVEEFLPEAGPLHTNFQPAMNLDIFPGNRWKAKLSISQFASAHQNEVASLGYNVEQQKCEFSRKNVSDPFYASHLSIQLGRDLRHKYQKFEESLGAESV